MGISLSGVGSGFDWQTTLEQLQQVEEEQYIQPLQDQKERQEDVLSAWNTVSTKLSDLLNAVQDMDGSDAFDLFSASLTSSSSVDPESLLSVSVGSGAAAGRFDIQVTNLAKAEKLQSASVSSASADAGWTGTITIEGNDITLDGKSLNDLRYEINTLNTGTSATGVMAAVLKVSDSDYRLILTSEEEGAAGIEFTDAPGDYFSILQAGEDAAFTVDGIAMTRSSNTITDAIEGVTLQLRGEDSATTVSVDISRDEQAVQDKVQGFVDAYNGVMEYINQQFQYNSVSQEAGGVLFGDAQLRSIKSRLQTTLLNEQMFDYGITFSNEGTLEFDADEFTQALSQDHAGTVSKFNSLAQSLQSVLDTMTDSVDGTVPNKIQSVEDQIDSLDDRVQTMEDRIDAEMERLKAQFIAMDSAMNEMNAQMSSLSQLFASFSS
ncbi:flagellar hook-associated protein 2 [Desulfacinum hydrothermale DSM 13146]|uniref:Flagellar hook-associated protein 2 n=1 Tax=Desulfacinum hydrothermale DSM 13146 TaxID=1121390 RepID=A0A1W1XEV3_9BACT|nr:flagellar filament capping protein FliD [Desulfacinum hydrothermale]SMC22436.1 flagellar hook-associated protein 2 [Desulfacinum hydrothermale DSM 13146]